MGQFDIQSNNNQTTFNNDGTYSIGESSSANTDLTAGQSYSYVNAGIQAITSVVSAALSVEAFKTQIKAKTDAQISNMDGIITSYEYKAYKAKEDARNLDSMYANKVSESMLDTLKKASYAKVAAAETGTYGGSTKEAIDEFYVDGQFNVAIINAERRVQNTKLLAEAEVSKQNAINSLKSIASGTTNVQADIMLSSLGGFTSGLGNLLTTMPDDVRANLFANTNSGKDGQQIAYDTRNK